MNESTWRIVRELEILGWVPDSGVAYHWNVRKIYMLVINVFLKVMWQNCNCKFSSWKGFPTFQKRVRKTPIHVATKSLEGQTNPLEVTHFHRNLHFMARNSLWGRHNLINQLRCASLSVHAELLFGKRSRIARKITNYSCDNSFPPNDNLFYSFLGRLMKPLSIGPGSPI